MIKFSIASLLFGIALILMGIFSVTPLGSKANDYAVELTEDSIQTFLTLRVVNAGLSLAQEVEFTGSIGSFSGSAQPLKILEPLDDAVEYLSTAVFIAGSFAAVVSSTLHIAGPVGLFILGFSLVLYGASNLINMPKPLSKRTRQFSVQMARVGSSLYLLVVSFALSSVMNSYIGDAAWSRHAAVLTEVAQQMNLIGLQADEDLSTLLDEPALNDAEPSEDDVTPDEQPSDGILDAIGNFGLSTAEAAEDLFVSTREAAGDAIASVQKVAGRAAHWSRVSAKAAEVMFTHADDLMIAFFAILAAYIFKLLALPILAYLVLSRLIRSK